MKTRKVSWFAILVLCFFSTMVLNYSLNGIMLRDLESNEVNAFMADVAKWSSSTAVTSPTIHSLCGSTYMLGGPDADVAHTFSRRYLGLAEHDVIYYSITVSLIDNWHLGDSFAILFDQRSYGIGLFMMDTTSFPQNECGASSNDFTGVRYYGKAIHSGPTLTLRVATMSHHDDVKSLGVRDVTLLFRSFTDEEKNKRARTNIDKNNCALGSIPIEMGECKCLEGQYLDSHGVCQSCDPLCKTCLGPLTSQCLSCSQNAFFDGTQCAECHSSCATCLGSTETDCLSCNSGDYIFNGKACSSSCNLPLISDTTSDPSKPTCTSNCDSDHYLFSDGSCPSDCPSTYKAFEAHGSKFCFEYCSAGMYYVPDADVCMNSCPATGYYQDNTPRYCKLCQDSLCASCPTDNGEICQSCQNGSILDSDGICKTCQSMDMNYVQSTDSGAKYTMELKPSTCSLSAFFVKQNLIAAASVSSTSFPAFSLTATKDSSVIDQNKYSIEVSFESSVLQAGELEVSLKYLSETLEVPKSLIASDDLKNLAQYAPVAKAAVTAAIGGSLAGTFALGATASLWSIINFQQFVGYFIYINIEYPFQVKMLFDLLDSASFDFLPNPIASLTSRWSENMLTTGNNADEKYKPPAKFVENGMSSFFIDNAGSLLSLNIVFLLVLLLVVLLRRLKKFKRNIILKKIKGIMRWNVILRAFLENGVPIMLAVFLQLRIMSFKNVYITLCTICAGISLLYCLVLTGITARILGSQNSSQLGKEVAQNTYGTLYEGISLEQHNSKYYNLLILGRGVLLAFVIVFCSAIPIIQVALLIPYNMALVYYLFKEASFEDKNLTRVNRVKEILILIAEFCILGLTFDMNSEGYYNLMGWITVGCFAGGLLIETMYMIILQIYNIRTIKKKVVEFWNIVCRWMNNASLKRKHRKNRLRQIHPQSLQVELTPVKEKGEEEESDEKGQESTAATEYKRKKHDLTITDLVNNTLQTEESHLRFPTDHSTIRFPTDNSFIAPIAP